MAPRKRGPEVREHILDVASHLFDGNGVRAVGMQQIIDEFGCGKALLYREFANKDDLIVAYLQRFTKNWERVRSFADEQCPDDPAGQLVAIVSMVAELVTVPGFRGCPVRNTHAEFPDEDHPAHAVSVAYYDHVLASLIDLAKRTGAADPRTLADRIMLIIDGLNASGAARGREGSAPAGVAFARDVVKQALTPLANPA
ncbi:TetR/AcrR family transcriptional regulator [Actinocrispum wychmicini]|uniref:TetR family transcriptional regulator n=1 Tax=Actinocrispum wychmicini TaxID=1213861 RepID=A0A4R2JAC2_9PSEU|nr:TetR/AcrR family transcriptional regulator [Actinocrispum wychmicini]TCO52899.1 TetR family transcriptional regulator [Actinocrispum wychmicini]